MKTLKAILYLRVATTDLQNMSALESQESMLKYYCSIHGIKVIGFYKDVSSGRDFKRPAFNKLLAFLKENKGVADLILVTTWDRFTRDWGSGQLMIEQLHDHGIEVLAINQPSGMTNGELNEICLN